MVDKTSGVPLHRQVAADLRRRITAGEYAAGDKLPSERLMIERYGVSRLTVREAIGLLRTEGVVIAKHGRGVFVRPSAKIQRLSRSRLSRAARAADKSAFLADAATGGFTPSSSVHVRFEAADERTATYLEVQPGEEVTVRDRVMRADGQVVQLSVSRLPRTFTRGTKVEEVETGPGGAYARLEEAGHTIGRYAEHVGSRMPTPEEASALQLSQGTPIITVTRVAYREDDVPLEMNDMVLPAVRYELSYEWAAE